MKNNIRTEIANSVLTITIERPELMNALSSSMHSELAAVFDSYATDDSLRVAVITGSGHKAFCAGSDIKERSERQVDVFPSTGFAGLTERYDLNKPVIAAINGHAIGGGLEIVLACDLAIAVSHAKFGLPEPRIGLAASGGLHRLSQFIPMKHAMEIALTSRLFSAKDALRYGLINQVVDAEDFDETVDALVQELLLGAPLSLQVSKQLMMERIRPGTTQDNALYRQMLESDDAREGMTAFLEKRLPNWKGH